MFTGRDSYKAGLKITKGPWIISAAFNDNARVVPSRADIQEAGELLALDVRELSKTAGATSKVQINTTHSSLGFIEVSCDDEFASKIRALPRVARMEASTIVHRWTEP